MKVLEYAGLDTARVRAAYAKVSEALARGDFRAAQVKKLVGPSGGAYYRARLNDADRLLFTLLRHRDETCVLVLEVIANHAYDKSRFLRGAQIDEAQIADADVDAAVRAAQPLRYLHPEHTTEGIVWTFPTGRRARSHRAEHPPGRIRWFPDDAVA